MKLEDCKTGVRVAVYSDTRELATIDAVTNIVNNGLTLIRVVYDHPHHELLDYVSAQQMRKLKPKRKAREFWMNIYQGSNGFVSYEAGSAYEQKEIAEQYARKDRVALIKVREVLADRAKG